MRILLNSLLILFTALSFATLPAQAHVHTGGGIIEHGDGGGGGKGINLKDLLNTFTLKLKAQEDICQNRKIEPRYFNPDFFKEYLSLSIKKSFYEADKKCVESKTYFKCLNSPSLKESFKPILEYSPDIIEYLKSSYNLDQKQASEALDFFKNLDSTCPLEKARCEM